MGFALEPPSSRWYSRLADRNHPNGDKNGNWEGVFPHGDGVHRDELNRGINAGRPGGSVLYTNHVCAAQTLVQWMPAMFMRPLKQRLALA